MTEISPASRCLNLKLMLKSFCDRFVKNKEPGSGGTCQQLQKAGYTPQGIFEETGFEPIQQNQIIGSKSTRA